MSQDYSLKKLTPDDWRLYKTLRLEALQGAHGAFGGNYAEESLRSDMEWQEHLLQKKRAMFALSDGQKQIGLTGVVEAKDDPEATALIASYIHPDYRGKGLSNLFYKARIEWSRQNGYKRVIVSHRASNAASKAANQKFGFIHTHNESKTWPDGLTEDNVFYKLDL
jgi:RimJ/RimL family protein N-acetyltransferase